MLSLASASSVAPTLVVAIGNPSRGDDALGPEIGRWLEGQRFPGVEVLTDFQCQVEHALDLVGRERVVFVDACVDIATGFELRPATANRGTAVCSHALEPGAVLHHYQALIGQAPPAAWILAVRGESFALGDGLSTAARTNLEAAQAALRGLIIGA